MPDKCFKPPPSTSALGTEFAQHEIRTRSAQNYAKGKSRAIMQLKWQSQAHNHATQTKALLMAWSKVIRLLQCKWHVLFGFAAKGKTGKRRAVATGLHAVEYLN